MNFLDPRNFLKAFMPQTRLNHSLRILITVNTIMLFLIGLFAPFYAVFVEHIGGNIAFAGLSWAVLSIVTGVTIILFSRWEVKVKEQEMLLVLGYVLRGVVFLNYAVMSSVSQLIFTQILWGIATALGTPSFDAIYSKHTTVEDSLVQWSDWEGFSAIAMGVASLIGGIVIYNFGYTAMFVGMAIISFVLGFYVWLLPRDTL